MASPIKSLAEQARGHGGYAAAALKAWAADKLANTAYIAALVRRPATMGLILAANIADRRMSEGREIDELAMRNVFSLPHHLRNEFPASPRREASITALREIGREIVNEQWHGVQSFLCAQLECESLGDQLDTLRFTLSRTAVNEMQYLLSLCDPEESDGNLDYLRNMTLSYELRVARQMSAR